MARIVSIKVPRRMLDEVDELCEEMHMNRSQLFRYAVSLLIMDKRRENMMRQEMKEREKKYRLKRVRIEI